MFMILMANLLLLPRTTKWAFKVMMLLWEFKFLSCAHKVQYAIEGEPVLSKDIASKQTFKLEMGWFENPTIVRTASHIFNTHTVYLITEFHKLFLVIVPRVIFIYWELLCLIDGIPIKIVLHSPFPIFFTKTSTYMKNIDHSILCLL